MSYDQLLSPQVAFFFQNTFYSYLNNFLKANFYFYFSKKYV